MIVLQRIEAYKTGGEMKNFKKYAALKNTHFTRADAFSSARIASTQDQNHEGRART